MSSKTISNLLFPEFNPGVNTYSTYLQIIIETIKQTPNLKRICFVSIKIYCYIIEIEPNALMSNSLTNNLFDAIIFKAILPKLIENGGDYKEVIYVRSLIEFFNSKELFNAIFPILIQNNNPDLITDNLVELILQEFLQNQSTLSELFKILETFKHES